MVSKASATVPTASVGSVPSQPSRLALPFWVVTSVSGVVFSAQYVPMSLYCTAIVNSSKYDCAIKGIRKKEDPWNAISAGFLTGGSLAIRGGVKAARNSAIMCAVFLAVIEGVGIGFQRMMADNTKLELPPLPPPEQKALA